MRSFGWPSPAKLNLFLHIVGRRTDGYHLLQTVFQFIELTDKINIEISYASKKAIEKVENLGGIVKIKKEN